MAIKYVYSGAAGANDGTSWANAWTDFGSADGAGTAAGDTVYVASDHSQDTTNAAITYDFSNGTHASPITILSVNRSDDTYLAGARLFNASSSSKIIMRGHIRVYGLTFETGWLTTLNDNGNLGWFRQEYTSCTFKAGGNHLLYGLTIGNSAGYYPNITRLINCTHDCSPKTSTAFQTILCTGCVYISNLALTGANTNTNPLFGSGTGNDYREARVELVNTDVSTWQTLMSLAQRLQLTLRKCKVHASFNTTGTVANDAFLLLDSCDDGTITLPPLGLTYKSEFFGTLAASLARYRTGGANDGLQANAYSWEMATNSSALEIYDPLEAPPLTRWLDPDASISGATAKGIFASTRCAPLATPAALTTDGTSTWNGTGVGTKQKITHTLTNGSTLTVYVASGGTLNNDDFWIEVSEPDQVGGPVSVRCFLAKPSTTVYVDPKLDVD